LNLALLFFMLLLQEEDEEAGKGNSFALESPAVALFLSPPASAASSSAELSGFISSDATDRSQGDCSPRHEGFSGRLNHQGSSERGKKNSAKQKKRHSWAGSQTSPGAAVDAEAATPGKPSVEAVESGVSVQEDSPW